MSVVLNLTPARPIHRAVAGAPDLFERAMRGAPCRSVSVHRRLYPKLAGMTIQEAQHFGLVTGTAADELLCPEGYP